MSGYYDIDDSPLELMEWARKFETRTDPDGEWRVGEDEIGEVSVSTVWLGLDHSFGNGPPLIFETMIFGGEHDGEEWRYSTKEQALLGHAAALELVKRTA